MTKAIHRSVVDEIMQSVQFARKNNYKVARTDNNDCNIAYHANLRKPWRPTVAARTKGLCLVGAILFKHQPRNNAAPGVAAARVLGVDPYFLLELLDVWRSGKLITWTPAEMVGKELRRRVA